MIGNKTLVLVVAVLAVGLFVMPSALSLFAGQHTFIGPTDVNCAKCHGAETGELQAGTVHTGMACSACHQTNKAGFNKTVQHASISPPCIACHDLVDDELLDESESHTEFYQGAMNATLETEANEACIGCHSMVGTDITWIRATTLTFVADHDPVEGWVIDGFTAEGSVTNTTTYP